MKKVQAKKNREINKIKIREDAFVAEFSEPALPRQSILGLGRLGREADLDVTNTKLNFETNFQKSQTTNLYQ